MSDYQVLPPLSDEEYAALKADIAERGVLVSVEVDEAGNVLDGHHRRRACRELGLPDPPTVVREGLSEDQKHEHALRLNLQRRHLTADQKRALIRGELDRDPGRSDRAIGRLVGADHKTVGAIRRGGGEIPHSPRRPLVTREEAEALTRGIREAWHAADLDIVQALVMGVPPHALAGQLIAVQRRCEKEYAGDEELLGPVREHLFGPRIDAVLEWPAGGRYADEVASVPDELRAVLVRQRGGDS